MRGFGFSKNKYRAKSCDGFPSKLEKALHDYLKRREMVGEITDIKRQQTVVLTDCEVCGTRVTWKVDFSFMKNGKLEFAEAKGVETSDYRRKLKIWKKKPPAPLEIYKGSYARLHLAERIEAA